MIRWWLLSITCTHDTAQELYGKARNQTPPAFFFSLINSHKEIKNEIQSKQVNNKSINTEKPRKTWGDDNIDPQKQTYI